MTLVVFFRKLKRDNTMRSGKKNLTEGVKEILRMPVKSDCETLDVQEVQSRPDNGGLKRNALHSRQKTGRSYTSGKRSLMS
jgi:hypothetical protein